MNDNARILEAFSERIITHMNAKQIRMLQTKVTKIFLYVTKMGIYQFVKVCVYVSFFTTLSIYIIYIYI